MKYTHEEVVNILRDEALNDPETGWLSDLTHSYYTYYDNITQSISVGNGSIDLGHLAGIVLDLIEGSE